MKRSAILRFAAWTVSASVAAACAVWGSGYLWSLRAPEPEGPAQRSVDLVPKELSAPGRPATAEVSFELPLCMKTLRATAEAGEGSVVSGGARIDSEWRWSRRIWRIGVTLRPLASGRVGEGKLTLEIAGRGGRVVTRSLVIPAFDVAGDNSAAPPGKAGIRLAGEEPEKAAFWNRRRIVAAALLALVLAAALALWIFLRRRGRRAAPPVPPWVRARHELETLRSEAASRGYPAERGVSRLTDIVRGYLEERFAIPAPARTTPEFIRKVESGSSPLGADDRKFLRDFMESADLVKFARSPARADALENAIGRAETLVERTTPRSDGPREEQEGKRP